MRKNLEQSMGEISGDLDRLDQRKNEITNLENQLTRVKRLEDDVNNKMTRFINEKTRIDQMKNDFDKLIKTSQSVEERLGQVTNSDDILEAVQLKLRKLEDAIKEAEEKYQRVERKGEVLDETNEGIARNFNALQTELQSLDKDIQSLFNQIKSQIDREGAKTSAGKDAPPPQHRDNVIRLIRRGWTDDQIANNLHISKGEVQLIRELGPKT